MSSPEEDRIAKVIENTVKALGYELVDGRVRVRQQSGRNSFETTILLPLP